MQSTTGTIIVDTTKELSEVITKGRYDWVTHHISSWQYPIEDEGLMEWEFKLFHFDRHISSQEAVEAIESDDAGTPWQPARIEHLCAFGVAYPEEQRKYPIIAMGSVLDLQGVRGVPFLGRHDIERSLRLGWWEGGWGDYFRVLAVRKKPQRSGG